MPHSTHGSFGLAACTSHCPADGHNPWGRANGSIEMAWLNPIDLQGGDYFIRTSESSPDGCILVLKQQSGTTLQRKILFDGDRCKFQKDTDWMPNIMALVRAPSTVRCACCARARARATSWRVTHRTTWRGSAPR